VHIGQHRSERQGVVTLPRRDDPTDGPALPVGRQMNFRRHATAAAAQTFTILHHCGIGSNSCHSIAPPVRRSDRIGTSNVTEANTAAGMSFGGSCRAPAA